MASDRGDSAPGTPVYEVKPEFRHDMNVTSVCFSKNGKFLATGSEDCCARIWHVATGTRILEIKHPEKVSCVSFGENVTRDDKGEFHNPKWIATGSWDMKARIFEIDEVVYKVDEEVNKVKAYELTVPANPKEGVIQQAVDPPDSQELCKNPAANTDVQQGGSQPNITKASDAQVVPKKPCKIIMQTKKHDESIKAVCFQPRLGTGNVVRIATGCRDSFARIFEAIEGGEVDGAKPTMKTIMHGDYVTTVCFSPDGDKLATGSCDKKVRIFDCNKLIAPANRKVGDSDGFTESDYCQPVLTSDEHEDFVTSVCFSPDGEYLATGCADRHGRVFALNYTDSTPYCLEIMKTIKHSQGITCVGFPIVNPTNLTRLKSELTLLEGELKEMVAGTTCNWPCSCCANPLQQRYDTKQARIATQNKDISAISAQIGMVATGCFDGKVRFFDIATGKKILKSIKPVDPKFVSKQITSFSFSQDCFSRNGSIAIGCKDISKEGSIVKGSALIFKVTHKDADFEAKEIKEKEKTEEKTKKNECFALFPDGKQVVKVNVVNTTLKGKIFYVDQNKDISPILFSVTCRNKILKEEKPGKVLSPPNPKPGPPPPPPPPGKVLCITVSPKKLVVVDNVNRWITWVATGGDDGYVHIFEFDESVKKEFNYKSKFERKMDIECYSVRFFCDQQTWLCATSCCILEYKESKQWQPKKKSVIKTDSQSIDFTPDGKSIIAGCEDNVMIKTDSRSIDFTPDGKSIIAGCEDGFMRMYSVDTGDEIKNTNAPYKFQGPVRSVCCFRSKQTSTDKDIRVATGSEDNHARIFNIIVTSEGFSATLIMKTVRFGYGVSSCCFSPTGHLMFAGCWDGKARFFNTNEATGEVQPIMIFSCDEQNPSVAWSSCHPDIDCVAFVSAETKQLQVLPVLDNFGADALLPLTESSLLQWAQQSEDLQEQCSLFRISHILRREFFTPDTSSPVVALAEKWPHPKYPLFLSTLCRLFKNVEDPPQSGKSKFVIINAGQILKRLLRPLYQNTLKESEEPMRSPKENRCSRMAGFFKSVFKGSVDRLYPYPYDVDTLMESRIYPYPYDVHTLKESRIYHYPYDVDTLKESREESRTEEARLFNVIRHADFAARDPKYNSFMCQLIDAADHGYDIQSISKKTFEIWTDLDELVKSNAKVVRNLELPRTVKVRPVNKITDDARKKFIRKYKLGLLRVVTVKGLVKICYTLNAKPDPNIQQFWTDLVSLVKSNASVVRRELPATVEALLKNVIQHADFAARDTEFIHQLVAAASIPSIQSTVNEFWTDSVALVKSNAIVARDLQAVRFSESTRMYVAGSKSFIEPVWEQFFQKTPFSENGVPLDFDHLYIPFPDIANMCDYEKKENTPSVLKSLVDLNNIDIFGNEVVQALVQFKWQTYASKLFWVQFIIYVLGLGIVVALSMLTWVQTNDPDDDRVFKIVLAKNILAFLLGFLICYSTWREGYQLFYSQPNSHQQQSQLYLSDSVSISTSTWRSLRVFCKFRLKPYLTDFWNIIDLLNIVFGIWTIVLVWAQEPLALPVLAVTAYLRWYGTLFYLQAFDNTGPYVRILIEIVWAIRWFLFIMLLSILATWNAFTLLLTRTCKEPDAEATCEMPRDVTSAFRTMFDMVNALLFGNSNLQTLEHTEYFGLVVFVFIISMIAMPIVLLNMLIAIMGHKYDEIEELSGKEAFRMKAKIILEVELFMKKKNYKEHALAQSQSEDTSIDAECSIEWFGSLWKLIQVAFSVCLENLWVSFVELMFARFSHEKWQTMFPKLVHAAGTEVFV